MLYKRLISALLAILLVFSLSISSAETSDGELTATERRSIPDTLYYQGGVVLRSVPRDADESELLQLAYVLTDVPYIVTNQATIWELTVTGGSAPYEIVALLAWQSDLSMDQFEDPWTVADSFNVTSEPFSYTFTDGGRFFWQFDITDSAGQSLSFQSSTYEVYTSENEADEETVVGKVNSIISELITDDMSAYGRARALHDWLIYNANYDYTYTSHDAEGVLLNGSGVCESYARAYLMLCTAAGIDCMYVSGTAGQSDDTSTWENHAWNLINLGGSWYHVDCTWDDPNEGGYERHTYFCVDDATMSKDHRWNQPDDVFYQTGSIVPDAEGGEFESSGEETADYDFTFSTMDEYAAAFDALIAAGEYRENTIGLYTGSEELETVWTAFGEWLSVRAQELANEGLLTAAGRSMLGNQFTAVITWNDADDYIRIDEESLRISINEQVTIIPSEYVPASDAFTWSSSDPAVATVASAYSTDDGLTAVITGVGAGTATITATSADGLSDSLTVTVLPAYQPDFNLSLSEGADGVTLAWDGIPGVTEYRVMRVLNGDETVLVTTAALAITLADSQLPANVQQQVYIHAVREAAGAVAASYSSEKITYGTFTINYTATLPAGTTVIGAEAFLGDTSLTAVYIPDGATTISSGAFSGCSALEAVRIPESVTSIASDAFKGSALLYAEVVAGSYADTWFAENLASVTLIYQ